MLDINQILNDQEAVIKKLKMREYEINFEDIDALHTKRKEIIKTKEDLSAEKNKISDKFKSAKDKSEKDIIKNQSIQIEKNISENKKILEKVENDLRGLLLEIPNLPDDDIPIGDESKNKVIKTWGNAKNKGVDHSSFFVDNGLLDFESAVTLSKSRFVVIKGQLAKLQRSLISFMLDEHINNGYTEYYLPYLVNSNSLTGTGQLPKFEDDLFKIANEELYLIPTGEVPLTGLYRDKIIQESDLPIKNVAHTPCFRSEAGSYGKDTKGMIRQHQFEKIEIVQIVKPDEAQKALDSIIQSAESILEKLNLPYQRVLLATSDLGFSASKTFDLEVWMSGQKSFREISSCSCFTDFQSRRLNIRYKDNTKSKIYPYTLNGSGLAVGRALVAILENYTDNNIINIPSVLQQYFGADCIKL
tara:strand:+ start:3989 stop:5236 length:1248 start_codon:yes stop_codon:yes gene_type:complete